MKILLLHNAYQLRGGEDSVLEQESKLLQKNGICFETYVIDNRHITRPINKIIAAIGACFSVRSYFLTRRLISTQKPTLVHVHNFFPLLSPSVFYACKHEHVPVILTLHNYRIICPTALLMFDGVIRETSVHNGPWWALSHRVYKNSYVGTFFLCLMIWLHRIVGTWQTKVDTFIALTDFGKSKFIEAGLPPSKIVVKPNFVDMPFPTVTKKDKLLFLGRLSEEKGVRVLLDAILLDGGIGKFISIAGEGPLSNQVAISDATYLGLLNARDVSTQMQSALALLMPSIWYEGFPMALVEAYANGLPVIASRIGALAELVEDGVTGLLFEPGNSGDLAAKMVWALEHPDEIRRMGKAARARYEALYTPERNYEQLMSIYRAAINSNTIKKQK